MHRFTGRSLRVSDHLGNILEHRRDPFFQRPNLLFQEQLLFRTVEQVSEEIDILLSGSLCRILLIHLVHFDTERGQQLFAAFDPFQNPLKFFHGFLVMGCASSLLFLPGHMNRVTRALSRRKALMAINCDHCIGSTLRYLVALMAADYPVILFYKYVAIADPQSFAAEQRTLCSGLGLKGRILIAEEGINGTMAGPRDAIDRYVEALRSDERFADIEIKLSPGDAQTFPKLVIKVRPEIVTLGVGPLAPDLHNHLSPEDWKRTLEEEPDVVVVDVRNRYESVAGKFENAIACDIENFRDLPAYVDQLAEFKDHKVLMYCTGGIRCEKASALFRSKGFTNVFQLHGGIAKYQEQFGNEHWLGECFVFDQRMTTRVEDGLKQIGQCAHTGRPTGRFVNCLHDLCHTLFLLAEETERENPETRLCRDCLASGLTVATADYKGSPARGVSS